MRKKIIAGNWKMNGTLSETAQLINGLKELLRGIRNGKTVVICPPFTSLVLARELSKGSGIELGAQNVHFEPYGAFTGEISIPMLKEMDCTYVILGHSERRSLFGETDAFINKKVKAVISAGLTAILCVGETLNEREKGITNDVVQRQLTDSLDKIKENELPQIVIAYEPVWAIGTGRNATPEQANDVHHFIRKYIASQYSTRASDELVILYGGSVKPDNASALLSMPHIDGALVGGASLSAESFAAIANS